MLAHIAFKNLLVIDIETVPVVPELKSLPEAMQDLWEGKEGHKCPEELTPQNYFFSRAGIYAEFGKVICISCGIFTEDKDSGKLTFRIKSFANKDEKKVLQGFSELLNLYYNRPQDHALVGHNIKEFDVPYLCRRMLVNGLTLPKVLDIAGKKPWETNFLDTLELWKFGDRKNYTSLNLLTQLFNIPSPKEDLDGSRVGHVFWHDNNLDRIVHYCQKDVLAVAQVVLRFKHMPLLQEEQITIVDV